MAQQCSPLDDIVFDLHDYINIPNLRPFFRASRLLTEPELEQLVISANNPTEQVVDRLISFLRRKGPDHAERFLVILQESMESTDSHLGHQHLCNRLQNAIEKKKLEMEENLRLALQRQLPDHHPIEHTDSGVLMSLSPGSRSSETDSFNSSRVDMGIDVEENLDQGSIFPTQNNHASSKRQIAIPGLTDVRYSRKQKGLDQQHFKIVEHFQSVTTCFAMMVVELYRMLKKKNAPVDEIRITLMFLGCEPGKPKEENTMLFPSSAAFSEAKDIGGLIECLRSYSSWYNYRLMKIVAEEFAGDEGKKLISDYEDNLRKHYVALIAYQCPKFTLGQGLPPGYTRLVVKVDWDYQSSRLQDIILFQSSLAKLLDLEPYVFQLCSIDEGCVLLTWAIPPGLEDLVANLTTEQLEFLENRGVLYLMTDSMIITVAELEMHSPHVKPLPEMKKSDDHRNSDSSLYRPLVSSSSSSLASILPITETEAELLSIYSDDAPENSARSSLKGSKTQLEENEFKSLNSDKASSSLTTDELLVAQKNGEEGGKHMAKTYHSEGNLLTHPLSDAHSLDKSYLPDRTLSKFSLPDMCRNKISPRRSFDCKTRSCRSVSILRSLKKTPSKLFLKFFQSSRSSFTASEDTLCNVDSSLSGILEDFPIFELEEEPKGNFYHYVLKSPTTAQNLLPFPTLEIVPCPSTLPCVVEQAAVSPATNIGKITMSSVNVNLSPTLTQMDISVALSEDLDPKEMDTRHSSMTSGIGSTTFSMLSTSSRFYQSQASLESDGRSSLCSSENHLFGNAARKDSLSSIISNRSVNSPIFEHTEPVAKTRIVLHEPEQIQEYSPWSDRCRAHSYSEDYYRRVHPQESLPTVHSVSSGYSSRTNSTLSSIQSSMTRVTESQESLILPFPSPTPVTPVASVKRGGSLKSCLRYSTREPNYYQHTKLHFAQKSLD